MSELFFQTLTAVFRKAQIFFKLLIMLAKAYHCIYTDYLKTGEKLPAPSRLESIKLSGNEALALIEVDLKEFEPD